MERISKMWRSGLALVLALCMVLSVIPATAFAAESDSNLIKYVSVGDSMTNGYGFVGYNQDEHKPGYDWLNGVGVYGDDAYPNQFAAYLEEQGYTVEHTQLALSAMRVENLPWLLGITDETAYDGDIGFIGYTGLPSGTRDAIVRERFQTAFEEADIISLAMGNASFNNFFNYRLFKVFGVNGDSYTESEPEVDLEDALTLVESESDKQVIRNVHDMLRSYLMEAVPAEIVEPFKIDKICDLFAYITASYCVNTKIVLKWIGENNPDAEVILMGIQNTYNGMTMSFDGIDGMEDMEPIDLSSVMYAVFGLVSAHVSTLPTVMQANGECEDVTFYFVDAPSDPALIATMIPTLAEQGWPEEYERVEGAIVRIKTRNAYNSMIAPMVGGMIGPMVESMVGTGPMYDYVLGQLSGPINDVIYEGLEIAIVNSMESMDINMGALGTFFNDLNSAFNGAPTAEMAAFATAYMAYAQGDPTADPVSTRAAAVQAFADFFSEDEMLPLVRLFALNKVGNGIAAHPTPETHDGVAADMIAAYTGKHTVQEETKENIKLVLNELKEFLKVYGPDVAEDVKALWIENGYQAMVDEYIAELIALVEARYNNYNNEVLPALGETVTALTAQKDALNAELAVLKAQLEVKKAELEQVLAGTEIPEISAPDLSIDAELGNNEQTKVPENDCEGAGNTADELAAAVADLEHAIAVIEALIADITADIDDMVALATEIAETVASLQKTLTDMIAAAQALKNAVDGVAEVLTNDTAKSTVAAFVDAYNAAREAALIAAEGLEVLMDAASKDAAAIEQAAALLDAGVAELLIKLEGDEDAFVEILLNNLSEEEMMIGGAAMLIISEILKSDDAQAAQEAKKAELEAKKAELKAEFSAKIEEAAAALEAKKAELEPVLKAEFEKKYAELEAQAKVEIAELEAAAAEKLAALEAELNAYIAELEALPEDALEEVRAGIQAQIDRVTGDIATVKADLICATEHINAALKAAYDALVIEITNIYNEAIAELQKTYDELVAAYEAAVKELEDSFAATIADLKRSVSEAIESLKNALIQKGIDSIEALVDAIVALINDILYQATHADLALDANSTYVGLGDSTAAADGYIELLAATLKAEFGINGHTNYAAAGNTAGTDLANIGSYEELAGAELITIGFSNVTLLSNAFGNALSEEGASYDWSELVGAELAPYAEEAMASVYAEIADMGLDAETTEMLGSVIEGIAYGAVEYAVKLPQLIYAIRAVNEDAVIAIVGQYNPMDDVTLKLGDAALNVSEYLDYFVNGIAAHGIAFAVVTGEAIFVEASEVETTNTDMEWTIADLVKMLIKGFETLNPSVAGDAYIANEIREALNITKTGVGLWGDSDGDGKLTLRDAILALQVANGKDVDVDRAAADVTGDGEVTVADAIWILKRANGHADLFPVEK